MTPPRPRKAAHDEVPSAELLAGWTATRERQAAEFQARAHAWLQGRRDRGLTWPDDQREIIGLGVPCDTCLEVITDPGDRAHVVTYAAAAALATDGADRRHWASAITARCGAGRPAVDKATPVEQIPAPRRPRRVTAAVSAPVKRTAAKRGPRT